MKTRGLSRMRSLEYIDAIVRHDIEPEIEKIINEVSRRNRGNEYLEYLVKNFRENRRCQDSGVPALWLRAINDFPGSFRTHEETETRRKMREVENRKADLQKTADRLVRIYPADQYIQDGFSDSHTSGVNSISRLPNDLENLPPGQYYRGGLIFDFK